MKGHCDYHESPPIEGGKVLQGALTFIQLLCADCGRKRGLRRVRKAS